MNRKGAVVPYKMFHYIIFILLFTYLLGFSIVFIDKAVRSPDKAKLEYSMVKLRDSVLIHKVINDCFVYDGNGREELGVVAKGKVNSERLKECLGGVVVSVEILDVDALSGEAKDWRYYNKAVLLDDGGIRGMAKMKIGVENG